MNATAAVLPRRLVADQCALPASIDPQSTRGRILAAALRLFAERGFGGTSVRDIAATSGLQATTMYAHFPSKEHVLAELVRIGHEAHHGVLQTALLASQPDPRLQVAALMRAHVAVHAQFQMLAVVANAELHALSPEFAAPALAVRAQSQRLLAEIVQRGMQMGAFAVPDAELAIAAISAMGVRVAHWYGPDYPKSVESVADIYAQFALRVLGVMEAPAG